jgi:hypothetical protein
MVVKKKGNKRRTLSVDMEGVESGGKIVPDGTYEGRIKSLEEKESSNDNPMLVVKWEVLSGKGKGGVIWDNISLTPQALWRLKGLLEALEIEVPDGAMDVDLSELEGQECSIQVTNERYEGKDRPRVTGYGSPGEAEEEEGEEEEDEDERVGKKPKVKPKTEKKKPVKDEDEEEESEEEEEEEEDDEEEEEESEEEDDEKPKKPSKKPAGKVKPSSKSKFKEGQKVKFKDEDGNLVRGVVLEVDGDTVKIEDKEGTEWEIESDDPNLKAI